MLLFCIGVALLSACHHLAYNVQAQEVAPVRVIWSSVNLTDHKPHLIILEGDPDEWVPHMQNNGSTRVMSMIGNPSVHGFRALSDDARNHHVYYANSLNESSSYLAVLSLTEGAVVPLYGFTSPEVDGIAYDWVNSNLYWTDSLYNQIGMVHVNRDRAGNFKYKIIISSFLDAPHGIAVHPGKSLIYWTDTGTRTLEQASLSGEHRKVVRKFDDSFEPTSLHLDVQNSKLYVLDSNHDEIYRCDVDGRNLEQVTQHNTTKYDHLRGIGLYNSFLFSCDEFNHSTLVWNLTDGPMGDNILRLKSKTYNGLGPVYDILVSSEQAQPLIDSPCKRTSCDGICVTETPEVTDNVTAVYNTSGLSSRCVCPSRTVETNGKCEQNLIAEPPLFLVYDDDEVCVFLDWSAHAPKLSLQKMCMHVSGGRESPLAAYYDGKDGFLFDVEEDHILRAQLLDQSPFPSEAVAWSTRNISGIAVDWLHDKVYWVSSVERNLVVARDNGSGQVELVSDLGGVPEGLVIDPRIFKMFLFLKTDASTYMLQSRLLDGSSPVTLVTSGLMKPRRITCDVMVDGSLYWTDELKGTIETCKNDGSGRKIIYKGQKAGPFGLGIFRDYMVWSDVGNDTVGIYWGRKDTGQVVQKYYHELTHGILGIKPGDVTVYENYKQLTRHGADGCFTDNGGCDDVCLPTSPTQRTCACGQGYTLDRDGASCVTAMVFRDFLLVSAADPGNVWQAGRPRDGGSGVLGPASALMFVHDQEPHSLALDQQRKILFLATLAEGHVMIKSFHFMTGYVINVIKLDVKGENPKSITLDEHEEKLYIALPKNNAIFVMTYNGSQIRSVLPVNSRFESPWDVYFDSQSRYLYWSSLGLVDYGPRIERMNISTGTVEKIVDGENGLLRCPSAISIDEKARKLLWVDCELGRLEMSNLDGSYRQLLHINETNKWQTMAVDEEYIYLADWTSRNTHLFSRKQKAFSASVKVGYSRITDLLIFRGSMEPQTTPVSTKTSTITLQPSPATDKPGGKVPPSAYTTSAGGEGIQASSGADKAIGVTVGVAVVAVILIAVIIIVLVILLRRLEKNSILNESDGEGAFENPIYDTLEIETTNDDLAQK